MQYKEALMVVRPTSSKSKFPLKWLVIGVAAGVAVYYGWGALHGSKAPAPQAQGGATPASTATVISRTVAPWTDFSGKIEAVSAVEIRPRVGGQIVGVHFRDGDEVKKGQPLFTIDPRPYDAELARAKGALVAAQSSQANAQLNYGRAQKLLKTKAISQNEFDLRNSGLAQANGNLLSAQGAVHAAQVNVDYAHITAPISGKISRAEITAGNQVEGGAASPLLASIVTVSPIYASFELDEQTFLHTIQGVPTAQLRKIPVQVGLSSDAGTPINATVHSFDNQISPTSGTIRVRALIPNKDGAIVPGLYAHVRIGSPDTINAILINPAAVGTDQNKKYVMVVNAESKAEYREVHLGSLIDGLQIVSDGLKDGETIVVSGLQRLRPGAPVQPMPVDMLTLKSEAEAAAPAAEVKSEEAKPEEAK